MKFAFIADQLRLYPTDVCCQVLGVSRSGYYACRRRPASARATRRQALAVQIQQVHHEHRQLYGSPRIHRVLASRGQAVCRNTVADIMKERQIRARRRRRFLPRTTDSNHAQPVAKNLLERQFQAARPDTKWAVDITYIPTDQGWLYLACAGLALARG